MFRDPETLVGNEGTLENVKRVQLALAVLGGCALEIFKEVHNIAKNRVAMTHLKLDRTRHQT